MTERVATGTDAVRGIRLAPSFDEAITVYLAAIRAEGLDVERLREAARRVPLPDNVTVAHIEDLAREYSHVD